MSSFHGIWLFCIEVGPEVWDNFLAATIHRSSDPQRSMEQELLRHAGNFQKLTPQILLHIFATMSGCNVSMSSDTFSSMDERRLCHLTSLPYIPRSKKISDSYVCCQIYGRRSKLWALDWCTKLLCQISFMLSVLRKLSTYRAASQWSLAFTAFPGGGETEEPGHGYLAFR